MTKLPRDISRKIDSKNLNIDRKFKHKLMQELLAMEGSEMAKKSNSKVDGLLKLFKYNFASVALVLVALVMVGGASAILSSNRAKDAALRETAIPDNLDEVLSADAIKNIALQDFPEGTLTGIEIEQEDEGLVYKVKFSDGSVRLYNAVTGEAIVSNVSTSSSDDSVPATDLSGAITLQQARDIAQQQRPGKIIKKIEMETEHGVLVYSVRFTDDGRVDVNAQSGEIVRTEGGTENGGSSSSSSSSDDSSSDSDSDSDSGSSNSGSGSVDDSDDDHDEDDNSGSGSHGSEDEEDKPDDN